ncbi:APC family permease [Alicyclobacillus mengziensis]|uniref:APC family permease n=1 Tax=Alicyclobacillus mengziensis TaxID=2931921 RepID=A0A9X7VYV5_9BACL|nr:APC family permease [Alicyclobacillus mengziensis]QSO47335.1 APC family permease [Alicyclobacillus mengziensis]
MDNSKYLKKRLGFWSLTAAALGGVIGSGWLFGAWKAAQLAGPASIITWIVGGIAMLLIGLVFSELGMVKPESGGLVRYPRYSNGRMVSAVIGLAIWFGFVSNPPTEAAGVVQYVSKFYPGLYNKTSGHMTGSGIILALILMAIFVVVNYFGVNLFAKVNTFVTALKFIVPSLTIIALFSSGFHGSHFSQYGGFAPNGIGASLSAVATAGIIFAYTGFRNAIDLSGEVKNPRRNVPLAILTTIIISIILYILLEIVFIGGVPGKDLLHGWSGVNLRSPFMDIAISINLMWLYWILAADSIVSPSGSSFSYTASNARNVLGLAKNKFFPRFFDNVHPKFGVPTRALILNFIVGIAWLIPFKSWYGIISLTGILGVYTFSVGSISVTVFRKVGLSRGGTIKGMSVYAPLAFIVSSLIIYWDQWSKLQISIWILLFCFVVYFISHLIRKESGTEIIGGLWLIIYVAVIVLLARIGDFGGLKLIPEPWMSIIVAIVALGIYYLAVANGVWYMRKTGLDKSLEPEFNEGA